MIIKILGSGCASCEKLEQVTKEAATNVGIEAEFVKVSEMAEIMAFGVMTTPALVIDDDVKLSGRVPSVADVEKILAGAKSADDSCDCSCGGCC